MDSAHVVKINAITVPEGSGDELGRRFAARAGAVDNQDGFLGFELFKPTDGRNVWLVVTRWRDEESFQAWVNSPAFGHGHQAGGDGAAGQQQGAGGDGAAGRQQGTGKPHPQGGGPVSVSSELWSFEVSTGSPGSPSA